MTACQRAYCQSQHVVYITFESSASTRGVCDLQQMPITNSARIGLLLTYSLSFLMIFSHFLHDWSVKTLSPI